MHAVVPLFSAGIVHAPDKSWARTVKDEVAAAFPKGKYDDYADSVSQACYWMRRTGVAKLTEEVEHEDRVEQLFRGNRRSASVARSYGVG